MPRWTPPLVVQPLPSPPPSAASSWPPASPSGRHRRWLRHHCLRRRFPHRPWGRGIRPPAPVAPVLPRGPLTPSAPSLPCGPCGACRTVVPWTPLAPLGPDGPLCGAAVAIGADVGIAVGAGAAGAVAAGAAVGIVSFESGPHAARTRAIPRSKLSVEKMRRAGMSGPPVECSYMPKTREAVDLFHARRNGRVDYNRAHREPRSVINGHRSRHNRDPGDGL